MDNSLSLFCLFSFFSTTILQENVDFSEILTQSIGVQGKEAGPLTATTVQ